MNWHRWRGWVGERCHIWAVMVSVDNNTLHQWNHQRHGWTGCMASSSILPSVSCSPGQTTNYTFHQSSPESSQGYRYMFCLLLHGLYKQNMDAHIHNTNLTTVLNPVTNNRLQLRRNSKGHHKTLVSYITASQLTGFPTMSDGTNLSVTHYLCCPAFTCNNQPAILGPTSAIDLNDPVRKKHNLFSCRKQRYNTAISGRGSSNN